VIANQMYKELYVNRQNGRASAIAIVLLLAIVPVMLFNIRRFRIQEARR
jgi:alpha-glucoside transport system permease protein